MLDTDVIVAALRSPTGASRRLLELLDEHAFQIVISVAMALEYETVLKRPQHLRATGFSADAVDEFITRLLIEARLTTSYFSWRPSLTDPNDEMILEAAINGRAEAIITFNTKHLIQASDHFDIAVLKPGDFLRRLTS